MAKLYFKYGAMGSSKTAQALTTKFNYEERGMKVWLIKPTTDTRDGDGLLRSRIGLFSECEMIDSDVDIYELFGKRAGACDVIITDECQFFTPLQIDEMRRIVDEFSVPVMCFGLRTDFKTKLFPGSARLFEIADSISEIKTICDCGSKATVNARFDSKGRLMTHGTQVVIGGNERYLAMCHKCYSERIRKERAEE
ncbi:MAG: thymidine kinase [Clostridia bacterium]|nr:thymidine kinase [Clostridia bacterium]